VRKSLVVVASLDTVRILDQNQVVATHRRSYDRGQQIEDPAHIEGLAEAKAAAGPHRRNDVLAQAAPASQELLESMGERGLPLGRATNELLELLRTYGPQDLQAAVKEAIRNETLHTQAVRHILERNRKSSGKPPALPLPLPDDPRLRDLFVKPHDLTAYEIQEDADENGHKDSRDE
jgi:hypothetical protein